jgi:PTS system mannitol-specific IIC component
MKAQSKGAATPLAAGDVSNDLSHVRKIIVACDAGMGSSAMGAGVLRKKVQDAGLTNISVTNSAINSLPPDVDLVITHRDLTERAMRQVPQAQHYPPAGPGGEHCPYRGGRRFAVPLYHCRSR